MEAEDAGGLDRVEEFARTTLVANGSELLSKQLLSLVQRRVSEELVWWDQSVMTGV